jgi:hypothetical protein
MSAVGLERRGERAERHALPVVPGRTRLGSSARAQDAAPDRPLSARAESICLPLRPEPAMADSDPTAL